MTITAVTPPDAASDPAHPDHDRWVKEKTLAMEVEHAKLVGLPLRYAETENARLLARADQIARQPVVKPTVAPSAARADRHQARGITRKSPRQRKSRPECSCGLCVPCRRKMRVLAIFTRRKSGDVMMRVLGDELFAAFMAASTSVGAFKGMRKSDATRALVHKIDAICDRTIPTMGQWR